MIKKMSSQELNNILLNAQKNINDMNESVEKTKKITEKQVKILSYEAMYLQNTLEEMSYQEKEEDTFILLNNNYKGLYSSYSNVVHAYFKKEPINIFNLKAINTDIPFFREDVIVKINDVENDYFKNILKDNNVKSKEIFFEEYIDKTELKEEENSDPQLVEDKNKIVISFEVDPKKTIGISKFNMIEIDPFLYKSFDIESIKICGEEDEVIKELSGIRKAGKTRLILDKKYTFRKVIFTIIPRYKVQKTNEVIIPFGLKHIFFYECDFRTDSYLIIRYTSDSFIDNVKNDIKILSPYGFNNSTIKEEGIQIYLDNNNGILENEQEPSENIKKPIARNLNTIYFRVPLATHLNKDSDINNTIIGYKFLIEKR